MEIEQAADDFRSATDELRRSVTLEAIARACGLPVDRLFRAMLVEASDANLPPPPSWREDLASLARERAAELEELADELEASAWAPASEEELEEIGSLILNRFEGIGRPGEEGAAPESVGTGIDEPPALVEERQEDFEKRWEEIERRRAERRKRREDRKRQQEEEITRLNQQFLRGIEKFP
jgi:hypothetical protein